jgi:hypothetical protein
MMKLYLEVIAQNDVHDGRITKLSFCLALTDRSNLSVIPSPIMVNVLDKTLGIRASLRFLFNYLLALLYLNF